MAERLGVGIIGSGFMTRFHIQSWRAVRHADITAICSRNAQTARDAADMCRRLRVGEPRIYQDVREMVRDPRVDAVWVVAPNYTRVETVERICEEVLSKRAALRGICIEKPLARNVSEAKQVVKLVEETGLLHGYLENQVFSPLVTRGREILWRRGAAIAGPPYLARCSEEHSGPHRAWFWSGQLQGGGALSDMMCHSVKSSRLFLTKPGASRDYLKPLAVTGRIASLKWTRPEYIRQLKETMGQEIDYSRHPVEDYAYGEIVYETAEGQTVIAQTSTSWSYVGPGLRLSFEVLGPEYSLMSNSLDPESQVFFSRRVHGPEGEDLVEKQAAEQGLLPYLWDEAGVYGYTDENRHMVESFLDGVQPIEDLYDGLRVVELVMACYMSAELNKTLAFPVAGIDDFIPQVAQGTWDPRSLIP